jgi:hypothetical protein
MSNADEEVAGMIKRLEALSSFERRADVAAEYEVAIGKLERLRQLLDQEGAPLVAAPGVSPETTTTTIPPPGSGPPNR